MYSKAAGLVDLPGRSAAPSSGPLYSPDSCTLFQAVDRGDTRVVTTEPETQTSTNGAAHFQWGKVLPVWVTL